MLLKTLKETEQLAEELAKGLKGNELIFLIGELGSGKTTFTKFFAKALGVKGIVNSPTFVTLKSYPCDFGTFHHVDAYKINDIDNIEDEMTSDNIRVIEWANNLAMFLEEPSIIISFRKIEEGVEVDVWRK